MKYYKLDRDTKAYLKRMAVDGIKTPADIYSVNDFVVGLKDLNLWGNLICWPLRANQNAGTGTKAYSLGGLGTYNGTLVNNPSWQANGITVTSTATITDGFGAPTFPVSLIVVGRRIAGTGSAQWEYVSSTIFRSFAKRMYVNNSAGIGISAGGYVMLVNNDALTLTDNFELVGGIVPSATNSQAEFFVNTTKPAQTAGAATWGTGSASGATLRTTSDGQFQASFHAVFNISINVPNFYNLYKSTLGKGLALP
jgi:hypothetical protein